MVEGTRYVEQVILLTAEGQRFRVKGAGGGEATLAARHGTETGQGISNP